MHELSTSQADGPLLVWFADICRVQIVEDRLHPFLIAQAYG